jgi:putative transcriptional regulator
VWFLFRAVKPPEHAVQAFGGIYLSSSRDLLVQLLGRDKPMDGLRIFIGHSGWAPGQLETEIQGNGWLHCAADSELIFGSDPGAKYERALKKLGIDPGMLSSEAGHA